jgi:hypothetical protein
MPLDGCPWMGAPGWVPETYPLDGCPWIGARDLSRGDLSRETYPGGDLSRGAAQAESSLSARASPLPRPSVSQCQATIPLLSRRESMRPRRLGLD